ncbi:hypothetical protein [Bdellovibrio sp. HCB-162]|uniref:hypothetical protein n=1 Tax=Bdellovibrio sp. HCB-162 TaxID=3394234 RepID=UPI0039BD0A88
MKGIISFLFLFVGTSSAAFADWQFGLSVGYSPNYQVKMTGHGTSSGTPYFNDYNLEYDSSGEFGVDAWNTPQNAWGFISGVQIGSERKFKSGTINGLSIPTSVATPKYQTNFFYIGTAYRWENFYIPLAIVYGITKYTSASPMDSIDIKNGIGAHLGVGWIIHDHFVIEYIGRAVTTELDLKSGSTSEKTTGTIGSAVLNFKYLF